MSSNAVLAIQDIGQDVVILALIAALVVVALAYRKQARIAAPPKEAAPEKQEPAQVPVTPSIGPVPPLEEDVA